MLWLVVAVVLLRGLSGIARLASAVVRRCRHASAAPAWPDDAARAYAIEFATAYLTIAPDDPGARMAAAELAAAGIADALAPTLDGERAAQQVESATVGGCDAPGRAARVDHGRRSRPRRARSRTIRLTVPVARDARGGLVVNELPSLAAAPSRAGAAPLAGAPILGGERAAIGDVLTRFLRAYLSGDRAGLGLPRARGHADRGQRGRVRAARAGLGELDGSRRPAVSGSCWRPRMSAIKPRGPPTRCATASGWCARDRWYVAAINDSTGERTP